MRRPTPPTCVSGPDCTHSDPGPHANRGRTAVQAASMEFDEACVQATPKGADHGSVAGLKRTHMGGRDNGHLVPHPSESIVEARSIAGDPALGTRTDAIGAEVQLRLRSADFRLRKASDPDPDRSVSLEQGSRPARPRSRPAPPAGRPTGRSAGRQPIYRTAAHRVARLVLAQAAGDITI